MEGKKNSNFYKFFIIFLTSFCIGVVFSLKAVQMEYDKVLKTSNYLFGNNCSSTTENEELNISKFWKVYNIAKDNYFDWKNVVSKDLIEGAIYGLVDGLKDKNSSYFNLQENQTFTETLHGDVEGIGAVVAVDVLGVRVESIIKYSPALKADLRVGDIITKANGQSLEGYSVSEAVNYIKGPAGSTVKLEIIRENEILIKEVTRDRVKVPSVEFEKIEDNLGYITINIFGDETSRDFEEAIYNLRETDGIIIDLRNNGGGYLMSAVQILSSLIEKGEVLVVTKYNNDKQSDELYRSGNNGNLYNGKIVVLINENSASASEITAGALKEYGKATIVGKKSYGKGSVQKPFELGDGSMVKFTVAKWFTPKGVNIDEEGIIPDIEVSFKEEDFVNQYDRQKEEAKRILKELVRFK